MKITITTDRPNALLESIRSAIEKGKISTWIVDADGDFMHGSKSESGKMTGQWIGKAWLRPKLESTNLVLTVVFPKDVVKLEQDVEGVYIGRFAEMIVNHFQGAFKTLIIS